MKHLSLNKQSLILTTFSAVMVLPSVSVSAQDVVITPKLKDNSDLQQLNLVVDDNSKALFSSFSVAQSPELTLQKGEQRADNHTSSNVSIEKIKQQKQGSFAPASIVNQVSIITPQAGTINTNSTNISIQHHPEAEIKVMINGKPIDKDISSYTHKDEEQQLYTKIWYNVPLSKGENTITAKTKKGNPVSVKVFVEEQKAKISINPVG
ncbi:MAG: hypothetical protein AAFY76_18145, partial [Cyanobacteria bacterium J06649_11]